MKETATLSPAYWADCWSEGRLFWKGPSADKALTDSLEELIGSYGLPAKGSVFVPLCGDSPAIRFLYDRGYEVLALDYVEQAIAALIGGQFKDCEFDRRVEGGAVTFSSARLQLRVQDILSFPREPRFDLVYDRAALIAVAPSMRGDYASVIGSTVKPGGAILLDTREFFPADFSRPPYGISREEIGSIFDEFETTLIMRAEISEPPPELAERGIERFAKCFYLLRKQLLPEG